MTTLFCHQIDIKISVLPKTDGFNYNYKSICFFFCNIGTQKRPVNRPIKEKNNSSPTGLLKSP